MEPVRNLFRHPLRLVILWVSLAVGTLALLVCLAVLRSATLTFASYLPPTVVQIEVDSPLVRLLGSPEQFLERLRLQGHEVWLPTMGTEKGVTLYNFRFPSARVLREYYPNLRLVEGRWPGEGEAVMPERACRILGCHPGGWVGAMDGSPRYRMAGIVRGIEATVTLAVGGQVPTNRQRWVLWVRPPGLAPEVIKGRVVERAAAAGIKADEIRVDDARSLAKGLRTANLFILVLAIPGAAIGLLAAALLVAFNFTVNRFERAKEVAIKRALGASRGQIVREALIEAVALHAIAVLPVLAAAWLGWIRVSQRLARVQLQNWLYPEMGIVLLTASVALGLVVVAAGIPALATSLDPPSGRLKEE